MCKNNFTNENEFDFSDFSQYTKAIFHKGTWEEAWMLADNSITGVFHKLFG